VRRFFKSAAFPILLVVILAFIAQRVISSPDGGKTPSYTELVKPVSGLIAEGKIEEVTINVKDSSLDVKETEAAGGDSFSTGYPPNTEPSLLKVLEEGEEEGNLTVTKVHGTGGSSILSLLTYILPFVLFFGFWIFLMNQMQGGGSRVMNFGKSKAKRMSVDAPKITFRDVAGVDEAVQELEEIKEFLENPKKFQALGARIPKGVLLYGPPGTGKTLLARAVAGEAGVPFFSISGSDFVEMFVGVGASRVRDLFEQAKQNSPCIIFMDEIDAVGRHRGAGMGGGHDEREQTLNQLLVEMDGFEMKDNIILIAATNRPDILDPALLRPGRFDRQVVVDRPDRKGRKQILEVHTRGKPLGREIDLDALAGQTPGFTGADLANLINEAALLTARSGNREISMIELEEGIMRVIAGPEKKTRVMSEKERLVTAYHEVGHAIVGQLLPNTDPVHKISIISRGQALGYTISLPTEDKFLTTRAELTDTMAMTLGGRAAEEIVFGEITTGASNDLEKVTETAKQMVMRFGMSEKLGPRVFGHDRGQPFLGREFSAEPDYSDEIAREIDDEIRRIVEAAHLTAKGLLNERREELERVSKLLLERETIDAKEFAALLEGKPAEEVFKDDEEPTKPAEPEPAPERSQLGGARPSPRPRPGFAGGDAS
jgi:cell division protease FtsH